VDDSEERRRVAAPDDAQPCDDEEAELEAWLSGWQGSGGAMKRKREGATAAGEPEASTLVKASHLRSVGVTRTVTGPVQR